MPIPVPWDRNVFVENVAQMRGKPITLVPADKTKISALAALTDLDCPCGLWLLRDHDDIIVHEAGTTEYHIDQIVCHEIAHMQLGHRSSSRQLHADSHLASESFRDLLPGFDLGVIRAVLGRTSGNDQERDAEMFASMVMFAADEAGAQTSMLRSTFFRRS
ncbi:hypothetical protein [Mycobacterium attenuatum]|uniref:hypothetical protein n=1 Tax=Mycobacterium attenuatum TaxID=2341086 RepID=UPI000F042AED|nr:hypothetical protein [Mycobacterium attenuatum]